MIGIINAQPVFSQQATHSRTTGKSDFMKKHTFFTLLILGSLVLFARPAPAIMVNPMNQIFTTGVESITATYLGSDAADNSQIYMVLPFYQFLIDNRLTAPGTEFNLGTFQPNTELAFELKNLSVGQNFFNIPNFNQDLLNHVQITDQGNGSWLLGWEDRLGGGDMDYNDLLFRLNSRSSVVPEPGVLVTVGLGLAGLFGILRRRAHAVNHS